MSSVGRCPHFKGVLIEWFHCRVLVNSVFLSLSLVFQRLPDGPLHKLTPVVSKDQSLEIYQPIRLLPERLIILWDPATEFHYQHQMEVYIAPCFSLSCLLPHSLSLDFSLSHTLSGSLFYQQMEVTSLSFTCSRCLSSPSPSSLSSLFPHSSSFSLPFSLLISFNYVYIHILCTCLPVCVHRVCVCTCMCPGWKGSRENACAAKTCGITRIFV